MKKVKTKIICAVLAFCLLLGSTVSVFASDVTYTAQYGDKNSKEVYTQIIDDLDTILADAAFTGSTVQTLYALLPTIGAVDLGSLGGTLITGADTAEYYLSVDEAAFANLADFMADNGYDSVNTDVINAYFAEYPLACDSVEEFKACLDNFLNGFLDDNLLKLLTAVLQLSESNGKNTYPADLCAAVDDLCDVLGIQQDKGLYDCLNIHYEDAGMTADEALTQRGNDVRAYVSKIVDSVFPDVADSVIGILQTVVDEDNSGRIIGDIKAVLNNLTSILNSVSMMLKLMAQIDLTPVIETLGEISGYLDSVILTESGAVDWNATLGYIVNGVVIPMLAPGMSLQVISFGEDENYPNAILKFSAMNPANLSEADDTADALNVAMHYLYENINANKAKIDFLVNDVLPGLVTLPQEVTDIVNMITSNTESDAVWNIYSLLHVAAGYDEPVYEEPVTDPETPPSEDKPNTDKPNTDVPGGDKPAGTTPEQNSNGGENKPVLNSSNPDLPNTGAEEMTAAFIVIPLAAAGAFMLAVVLRKRALDK